jgi:hypothetical protein
MSFHALTAHRPSCKAYHEQISIPWLTMASEFRCAADECGVPPLGIRVRTIQLSPYRAGVAGLSLTHLRIPPTLQTGSCPLALSGLGKSFASESSASNSGLLRKQFAPCVTRRTDLSSRMRPPSATGMTFVFSVCRLVSRRCHNISAIHQLCPRPSQNRTKGFPLSGSSLNPSALQKGSG